MYRQDNDTYEIAVALSRERPRLVRLCTRLTGDADAAEDLAQDTCLEAWRHRHKLEDREGIRPWLSAIGRNVCLRWMRRRQGELSRAVAPCAWNAPSEEEVPEYTDPYDLVYELERTELAELLDRALALLPPQAHDVLIEKYVRDRPQDEIAVRLGLNAGTVSMRLHRGKLALRRILEHDLRVEAGAYGLGGQDTTDIRSTRIWCPFCGHQRLYTHLDPSGTVSFRCPTCSSMPQENVVSTRLTTIQHGVTSQRVVLSRQLKALHRTLSDALDRDIGSCITCGRPVPLQRLSPATESHRLGMSAGIYAFCDRCYSTPPLLPWVSRRALTLCLSAARRFWQEHPRMHVLPDSLLTYQGESAVRTRYQSIAGPATVDIISGRTTFAILAVHESPR